MKLVVRLDGERREVEVDLARQVVRVGAHEWPIEVRASGDGSVSFEILGERVEVRGDLESTGPSSGALTINGELHTLVLESSTGAGPRSARSPPSSTGGPGARGAVAPAPVEGPGHPIFPPMPGKILEVRVKDGDAVQAGQVLLVLEAMKMRNEVTSPVAGSVAGLRVAAGANVAARDVLLRILVP